MERTFCGIPNPNPGDCFWGKSKCPAGYWGQNCSEKQCPNSFCYQQVGSFETETCIHCQGRGTCANGTCICSEGYTGDDCSALDCINNCSNTNSSTVANCLNEYPLSVCQCDTATKRGGNTCDFIFCLNDCCGHGECDTGNCHCDPGYKGTDCSIYEISISQELTQSSYSSTLSINLLILSFIVSVIYISI